jgi:cobalamin biosynthesis protein CbiG
METYIAYPKDEAQVKALKAFCEALQVPFETEPAEDIEGCYTPEFNAKMKRSEDNYAAGRYEVIKVEDLWK